MRGIDKKNLDKIKKFSAKNADDIVVNFILDSLTKFFTANKSATYSSQGAVYF
jgi:hypothetical protein